MIADLLGTALALPVVLVVALANIPLSIARLMSCAFRCSDTIAFAILVLSVIFICVAGAMA